MRRCCSPSLLAFTSHSHCQWDRNTTVICDILLITFQCGSQFQYIFRDHLFSVMLSLLVYYTLNPATLRPRLCVVPEGTCQTVDVGTFWPIGHSSSTNTSSCAAGVRNSKLPTSEPAGRRRTGLGTWRRLHSCSSYPDTWDGVILIIALNTSPVVLKSHLIDAMADRCINPCPCATLASF